MHPSLLELTQTLIKCPSITPDEAGCFDVITRFFAKMDATILRLDKEATSNLFIYFGTSKNHKLLFNGHVDVVPPGNHDLWTHPPFVAAIADGKLFGRGAVDMKSSISAYLSAIRLLAEQGNDLDGLALLITSDEEGSAVNGTQHALKKLHHLGHRFSYGLIGEPTSTKTLGDIIKIGRRGSLSASVTLKGKQGHVAYPHLAINPIPIAANIIYALSTHEWDQACSHFPATHCCCTDIATNNDTRNVIPASCTFHINFRYSPKLDTSMIEKKTVALIKRYGSDFTIKWHHSAKPFICQPAVFVELVQSAIVDTTGMHAKCETSGGTSDARFVQAYVKEIAELGPLNATAHHTDEHISLSDLELLCQVYIKVINKVLLLDNG
ncbi:MAG: succinyl-diaminopimelate desuccinylase [Pseudomonadota bacterium]|nr:succinyl-diaminopimelate desuccinylase [Pseudomonadota bacterium]